MFHQNSISECTKLHITFFLTCSGVLGPRYLGETSLIISFRNLNFPTSAWNSVPHDLADASSTAKAWIASRSFWVQNRSENKKVII